MPRPTGVNSIGGSEGGWGGAGAGVVGGAVGAEDTGAAAGELASEPQPAAAKVSTPATIQRRAGSGLRGVPFIVFALLPRRREAHHQTGRRS